MNSASRYLFDLPVLIFFIIVNTGCSTVFTQVSPSQTGAKEIFEGGDIPLIYGGIRADIKMMDDIFNTPEGGQGAGIGFIYFLVDFPFSLVADTVLFPISFYRSCRTGL
jgi:uncharacterized protein YceK